MKNKLKEILGNILILVLPKKTAKLTKKGISFDVKHEFSLVDRLMRNVLLKNAEKKQDFNKLAEYHKNFWKENGIEYFSNQENTLEDFFIPNCSSVIERLQAILNEQAQNYTTMVEIGTGDGVVLNYLENMFPQIERFVGIDLSDAQTQINNKKFELSGKLEFVASDGFDWIKENGSAHTIFLTSRGVLEYLTEQRLQELFNYVHTLHPAIFVAIEPIGLTDDFTINPNSRPYGNERSFSHDYARLFKNAGLSLWYEAKTPYRNNEYHFTAFGASSTAFH